MTTDVAERPNDLARDAAKFRGDTARIAKSLLKEWVGEDRAQEAIGRVSSALAASAASARNPSEFYSCTLQSIATCIAVSALTGIMPGVGSTALAYVRPQRARHGEQPQLQYSLSHRGLNALSRRCGQTMVAVPVSMSDVIEANSDGDVEVVSRDIDNPPLRFEELRGVIVIVKEINTGVVLCRGWVPRKLIEQRRAVSRSFNGSSPEYSPWSTWPIEMSMKTAMHYAISRGWCVIDDTDATRALNADMEPEVRALPAPPQRIEGNGRDACDALADRLGAPAPRPYSEDSDGDAQTAQSPAAQQDDDGEATAPGPATTASTPELPQTQEASSAPSPHDIRPDEDVTTFFKRTAKSIREAQSSAVLQSIGGAILDAQDGGHLDDSQVMSLNDMLASRNESLCAAHASGALVG